MPGCEQADDGGKTHQPNQYQGNPAIFRLQRKAAEQPIIKARLRLMDGRRLQRRPRGFDPDRGCGGNPVCCVSS